jgi:hypothetical protein
MWWQMTVLETMKYRRQEETEERKVAEEKRTGLDEAGYLRPLLECATATCRLTQQTARLRYGVPRVAKPQVAAETTPGERP